MSTPTEPNDPTLITRRRLLGGAAAGATALAVSGTGLGRAVAGPNPLREGVPKDPTSSGIEHVVVVMMENRSFDHMLGWLPGANGPRLDKRYRDVDGTYHQIWHLDTFTGLGFHDPNHSYNGGRQQFSGGKCDGWLRSTNNDIYSIGYYTQDDLAFYGGAAPYWTVCDRFFASIMGPTYPNRFYMHSAATDRTNNQLVQCFLPTIWDRLEAAGLDGRYYYSDLPFTALYGNVHLDISEPYANFLTACETGALPHVSFVDPRFFDSPPAAPQCDDHPHADIRRGQHFLNQVYEAVSGGPAWENTVFVITYDEWGGFFDHVRPREAPDSNPAHALRGFRIPTLVISPRARRNYVASRIYDHTSILKMIEWRWGLPALSPRDAAARNLAEVLDFTNPPDLTAPRWDVPNIDAAEPLALSSLASERNLLVAERDTHNEEWARVGDLAAQHGFAV
jgi:phospholipase C